MTSVVVASNATMVRHPALGMAMCVMVISACVTCGMCFYGRLMSTFYLHDIYMMSAYKVHTIYTPNACDNYIYVYMVSTLYLHYVYIYYLQYSYSV